MRVFICVSIEIIECHEGIYVYLGAYTLVLAVSICIPAMQARGSSGATMRPPWPILHEPSAYRRDHLAIKPLRQSSRKPQTSVGYPQASPYPHCLTNVHMRLARRIYAYVRAGTRRGLNWPETVTDTDMFNLTE
jgi:hypothetical protein